MNWLHIVNCTIAGVFVIFYSYQFFYVLYGIFKKSKVYPDTEERKRYAVLIPARNEEKVLVQLIDSLKNQDYPKELVDIYVIADNCTDNTAREAEKSGAIVLERFEKEKIGKGYAMEFLFNEIEKKHTLDYYDGYFVFDADNLLDSRYISEMNKCFCTGEKIITSYRNSKNYGTNWITAGYSLWFLREARFLNSVRNNLNVSCAVSGTGFLVHKDIIKRQGGWKHFLLTEDIEFSVDSIIDGEKIAYCDSARFYDEQPSKFTQSWVQRERWAKGFIEIFINYGKKLLKGIFTKNGFSCFDMLMTIVPTFFLTIISVLVNVSALIYCLIADHSLIVPTLSELGLTFFGIYWTLFFVGAVSGIYEWKNIRETGKRKIWSFFTFPLFMLTYIPISIVALFKKVSWEQIEHGVTISIEDIEGKEEKELLIK